MSEELFQILYCSRNLIGGTAEDTAAEVEQILRCSQKNNSKSGVTGGLFFNTVFFAQVLEGPIAEVEKTFERIQEDPRHGDLIVLQSGMVKTRDFPNWSMAFAGANSDDSNPMITVTLSAAAFNPTVAGREVLSLLRVVVVQEEEWAFATMRAS